MKGFDHVLKNI